MFFIGNTESEIRTVLKLDKFSGEKLHSTFAKLVDHLLDTKGIYDLYIANKLYIQKSQNFLPEFLLSCEKHYKSAIEALDFQYIYNYYYTIIKLFKKFKLFRILS